MRWSVFRYWLASSDTQKLLFGVRLPITKPSKMADHRSAILPITSPSPFVTTSDAYVVRLCILAVTLPKMHWLNRMVPLCGSRRVYGIASKCSGVLQESLSRINRLFTLRQSKPAHCQASASPARVPRTEEPRPAGDQPPPIAPEKQLRTCAKKKSPLSIKTQPQACHRFS